MLVINKEVMPGVKDKFLGGSGNCTIDIAKDTWWSGISGFNHRSNSASDTQLPAKAIRRLN